MQGVAIPISMVAGSTVFHRINPLPKLALALGVLIFSFATRNPALLGGVFVLGLALVALAKIGRPYLRVVMVLFPVSLTLVVFQSIAPAFPPPWTPITSLGPFTIYQEGIYSGISMLLRIFVMTTFALIMIMTSHPSDLFTSLQKIGMPHVLNFILTMTLQLIPILQSEFAIVLSAQKSRGMKGTGFGAVLPSMVPVFVGAIERVQQLSISLESRAFGSTGKKTSFRNVTMSVKDYIFLIVSVLLMTFLTAWVIIDKNLDWSRTLVFPSLFSIVLVSACALGFIVFFVLAVSYVMKT
jgi:energy-coupling factor transport system permease protein